MTDHVTSRRALLRGAAAAGLSAPFLGAAGVAGAAEAAGRRSRPFAVLVYSRTTGFRHSSIPFGITAVRELGDEHGFAVDATEDPAVFDRERLREYSAVIFLNTTGTVLDTRRQQQAFEQYIHSGGGFVGVHSAADTEYEWPFYARLIAAHFKCHPAQQPAIFHKEKCDHPATKHLAEEFTVVDEFYSFQRNPRPHVRVLLTIDEETYQPDPNTSNLPASGDGTINPDFYPGETGYMGDHPMSWCHDNLGGIAFYTALGHEAYLYNESWYRTHLLGGILSAARQVPVHC